MELMFPVNDFRTNLETAAVSSCKEVGGMEEQREWLWCGDQGRLGDSGGSRNILKAHSPLLICRRR